MEITDAMKALLLEGFRGPRPGSNAFPLLELSKPRCLMLGEEIDQWVRDGLLTASPVSGTIDTIKGGDAGPYGEIPDVDCTHNYQLTAAGRARLGIADAG